MSSNDTKHDVPVQSGCCGGQSASAPAKEHGHHHAHHAHHAHGHAHGAKADACCATEASEPAESECCQAAEAPKPVAKVEKKPQGGGCCSH